MTTDIHPEARERLARALDYVGDINNGVLDTFYHDPLAAISDILRERDEARADLRKSQDQYAELMECHLKALSGWPDRYAVASAEADSLRAQLAQAREALDKYADLAESFIPQIDLKNATADQIKAHLATLTALQEKK